MKQKPPVKKAETNWFYSEIVKEHFFNPRNICKTEKELEEFKKEADGYGITGSPVCGDQMEFLIKVDSATDRIKECRWRTFGCASALASTSVLSEMITEKGGMKISEAVKLTPQDIIKRLHGLPAIKVHCSVLGDQALRAAIKDYLKRQGRESQ